MSAIHPFARAAVGAAGAVSPKLTAAALLPVFMHVGNPRPVAPDARATMDRGIRSAVTVPGVRGAGVESVVYEWGSGPHTVVLAHGWQGRASQFATLVRDLVAEGYRVVAFDAPAHGESSGRHTYLFDWIDVLRALEARHGRFHAIVGHSFGALGAVVAVAEGVGAERIVSISAPADADTLLRGFASTIGSDDLATAALRTRFARRYFDEEGALGRISAVRRRLPGTDLLVVHDVGDLRVPHLDAQRIVEAHPNARLLSTRNLGHTRILTADAPLDAILEFLAAPPERARVRSASARESVTT